MSMDKTFDLSMNSLYFSNKRWSFSLVNVENTLWGFNCLWHVGQIGFVFCNMWRSINLLMFPTEFFFYINIFLGSQERSQCFFFMIFFRKKNFQPPVSRIWTRDHTLEVPTLEPDFHSLSARRQKPTHVASAAASAFTLCSALSETWDGAVALFVLALSDMNEKRHFSKELTRVIWQDEQLSKWGNQK